MKTPLPIQPTRPASYSELWARLLLAALIIAALLFTVANAWGRMPLFVLRALESLPVWKGDREPETAPLKAEQNIRVAAAIASVARDADEAAMLLTIGHHESAWSLAVERGEFTKGQGDPDRSGAPSSISNYQIKRRAASSLEAWEAAKTDVRVATQEAAFALRRARNMCRSKQGDPVRMAFAAYGRGSCDGRLKDIEKRVDTFKRIRVRL
jgi:hypothetical protein